MKRKVLYILLFGLLDVALEPIHAAFMETPITWKSVIEAFVKGCIFGAVVIWVIKPTKKKEHIGKETNNGRI